MPTSSWSITCASHPSDSTAQYIGSFVAIVDLSDPTNHLSAVDFNLSTSTTRRASIELCVWLTSTGQRDLIMKASSVQLRGDCDFIDTLGTSTLFALLARGAIEQGLDSGYITCSSSSAPVTVQQESCVQRTGSCESMELIPCSGSGYSKREYTVSCIGGARTVTLVWQSGTTSCTGGSEICESTCQ
jgi:hypothetical protein